MILPALLGWTLSKQYTFAFGVLIQMGSFHVFLMGNLTVASQNFFFRQRANLCRRSFLLDDGWWLLCRPRLQAWWRSVRLSFIWLWFRRLKHWLFVRFYSEWKYRSFATCENFRNVFLRLCHHTISTVPSRLVLRVCKHLHQSLTIPLFLWSNYWCPPF